MQGLKRFPGDVGGDVHHPLLCCQKLLEAGHQIRTFCVAQDDVRLQKGGGGIGESLGHAAGEHRDRAGVVLLGAAQRLAHLVVALGGDGAGVDHHHAGGLVRGGLGKAGGQQGLQHGLGLVLIDLAAKGDDFYSHMNAPIHT